MPLLIADALNLTAQSSVVTVLIHFLVLKEISSFDMATKLLWREEIILTTMLLYPTRRTTSSRNRETQAKLWMLSHQASNDCTFTRSARRRDDNYLGHALVIFHLSLYRSSNLLGNLFTELSIFLKQSTHGITTLS